MSNNIETVRSMSFDYLAAYVGPTLQVEKKSKPMDLNNTPKPMSSPINDLP